MAAQHIHWEYPAAYKFQQSQCTSLTSSSNLKAWFKKSTNFRNKGQWEKGAFCLRNSFLGRPPPWKQLWIISTFSFSNHRTGSCHCCEKLAKLVHAQKKTSISEVWSLLQPFCVPFQRGHKNCQYHLLIPQPKQQVFRQSTNSRLSDWTQWYDTRP